MPRLLGKPKYAQRNIIERMFGWLKDNRRIGTRYDKLAESFAAMISLACSLRCSKQLVSYRAYVIDNGERIAPYAPIKFAKPMAPVRVLRTFESFADELDHQDWPEVVPLLRRGHTATYEHGPVPWE